MVVFGYCVVPDTVVTVIAVVFMLRETDGHFIGRCKMIACVITAGPETVYTSRAADASGRVDIRPETARYYPPWTRRIPEAVRE